MPAEACYEILGELDLNFEISDVRNPVKFRGKT